MLTIKRPIIKRTATTGAAVLFLTVSAVLGAPVTVHGATADPLPVLELDNLVPTSTDVKTPGITRTTYKARTGGPWHVNVVVIDPDLAPLTLKGTFGTGLATSQTSSSMLQGVTTTAVRYPRVGINGAFFDGNTQNPANSTHDGDPSGIMVRGGKLLSEAAKGKGSKPVGSALVLQHGRARITELSTTLTIQPKDDPLKHRQLDGINRVPGRNAHCEGGDPIDATETFDKDLVCRDPSEIVSFTPEYAGATPTTAFLASSNDPDNPSVPGEISGDEGIEVLLNSGNKVIECHEPAPAAGSTCKTGKRGGRNVPSDGRILQGTGDGATWLRSNAPVNAVLEFPATVKDTRIDDPLTLDPSMYITPGGDLLLKNGKIDYTAGSPKLDPRTAVASDATGRIMFVTVDGNDATLSKGATRLELATLLKELGAVDALNMDGGGSTTLVWQNTVVNHPSDGNEQERPVADTVYAGVGGYPLPPRP